MIFLSQKIKIIKKMEIENRSSNASEDTRVIVRKEENVVKVGFSHTIDIHVFDTLNIKGVCFIIYRYENDDHIDIIFCNLCNKIIIEGGVINDDTYEGCSGVCGKQVGEKHIKKGCGISICGLHPNMQTCAMCCISFCDKCQNFSEKVLSKEDDFICSFCS
jgi:hypothetical protein